MDFLLILGLLIALVWGGVLLLRLGLVAGCASLLLTGSCFGFAFFNLPGGPIPITVDRLLWGMLIGQYVIYRRWGLAAPKPLAKADYLLLAYAGLLLISTFTHDWTITRNLPASRLLFFYLMPMGLYVVARGMRVEQREVLGLWWFLGFFTVYLGLTALAETRGLHEVVFPKYIVSTEHAEFFGRGRGPFLNPVGVGIFAPICSFAALMCWPYCGRAGRVGLVVIALAGLVGTYATLTRSCWMGAALGLMILAALGLPRSWRVMLLGSGLLAGALFVVINWENLVAFKRDKDVSAADVADSAKLRPILATVAWKMFLDRPLLGFGFGQYEENNKFYLHDRSVDLPLEKARVYVQHNSFLAILTDTGVIGLGLYVALLVAWGYRAWKLWDCAAAPLWAREQGLLMLGALGVYLPNAMFHDVSIVAMVNMMMFFMAGLSAGLASRFVPVTVHAPATLATPRLVAAKSI
ncbi:MAG: O-antigen ligase family protein [Planctomycetes bacterium]|nr:O-antigen ligase family protein [Planctomycetota bacterium]